MNAYSAEQFVVGSSYYSGCYTTPSGALVVVDLVIDAQRHRCLGTTRAQAFEMAEDVLLNPTKYTAKLAEGEHQ